CGRIFDLDISPCSVFYFTCGSVYFFRIKIVEVLFPNPILAYRMREQNAGITYHEGISRVKSSDLAHFLVYIFQRYIYSPYPDKFPVPEYRGNMTYHEY